MHWNVLGVCDSFSHRVVFRKAKATQSSLQPTASSTCYATLRGLTELSHIASPVAQCLV